MKDAIIIGYPAEQPEPKDKWKPENVSYNEFGGYNQDSFHLQHAMTVEGVMRWYACQLGFADEVDFWGIVGLLHDIDFEQYPEEHCIKAPELLREGGVGEEMIHAICSHGYGHVDVKPENLMEKVLFITDELTLHSSTSQRNTNLAWRHRRQATTQQELAPFPL